MLVKVRWLRKPGPAASSTRAVRAADQHGGQWAHKPQRIVIVAVDARAAKMSVMALSPVSTGIAIQPPVAKIAPKTITIHGDTRVDNYFWLRDRNDPDTIKYLEAENRLHRSR